MPPVPPVPDAAADRIRVKRVYRAACVSDGKRILVDRLWPRGPSKDRIRLPSWCREIAPSDELRRWYHANPERWEDFADRYRDELARGLADMAADGLVTLLFATSAETRNNATVLRDHLLDCLDQTGGFDGQS